MLNYVHKKNSKNSPEISFSKCAITVLQITVKSINWMIIDIIDPLYLPECGLAVADLSMTTEHTTINTAKHLFSISLSTRVVLLRYFKPGMTRC